MENNQINTDSLTETQVQNIHKNDVFGKRIRVSIYEFIAVRDTDRKLLAIYYIHKMYGTEIYSKAEEECYEKSLGKDWQIKVECSFDGPINKIDQKRRK